MNNCESNAHRSCSERWNSRQEQNSGECPESEVVGKNHPWGQESAVRGTEENSH